MMIHLTDPSENSTESVVDCTALEIGTWSDWLACQFADDVAVFRFPLADWSVKAPDWTLWLSPDELQRAGRYRRADDQYRSLYTRSLLRLLIGKYNGQVPSTIRLTTSETNKPELPDHPEWHINASHAGNWILLAVGKVAVGVDVEEIKPDFPFQDVLTYSFSESEQRYVGTDEQARFRFYELWTRKEALAKATAKGIDKDFVQLPSLTGNHQINPRQIDVAGSWKVVGFSVADGYPGAVAYQYIATQPRFYTVDSDCFIT